MQKITSESITLAGGLCVSLDALQLGWRLEARGVTLRLDGAELAVGPRRLLTDADRAEIRRHRAELVALVGYTDTVM
jgi:hypothetical protein